MAGGPEIEVPKELRAVVENSLDQARQAVDGFMQAAHKALDANEQRVDTLQANAREIGRTTLGFAQANIAAGFDFAARLAQARGPEEWNRLCADFAMQQARNLSEQARALGETGAHIARSASAGGPTAAGAAREAAGPAGKPAPKGKATPS